jgi:SpoIID/LytB domain protein
MSRTRNRRRLLAALALLGSLGSAVEATSAPVGKRPLRFDAPPAETLLVHGTYRPVSSSCPGEPEQPVLHERYRGAVEVHLAADGSLFLIGELSLQDYLKGIAEVPRDWPMETLKAQVVAARSYALARLDPGGLYDLCATAACQVYLGAGIELGPWGDRWSQAVDETAGEVLLHRGRPAVTYYSSTSPGRTFDNEDVFGGEPLPYLRGRPEHDDGASPLSRWKVRILFGDLRRFLDTDGRWPGGRLRTLKVSDGMLVVRGKRRIVLTKSDLRDAVNDTAPCVAPARYPPFEPDGYRLPQSIPSIWFRPHVAGRSLVLDGRGWGHGVGMVQWGAYGKARRGLAYGDILASYYGGLRPRPWPVPGRIRVLVAEGLTSITVAPSGNASVLPTQASGPPWRVTGGRRLRLKHGSAPPEVLDAPGFRLVPQARRIVRASANLATPALVRLEFLEGGEVVAATEWRSFDEGLAKLRVPVPDVPPGRYDVRARISDGVDIVRTATRRLSVLPTPSPSPTTAPLASPTPHPAAGTDETVSLTWLAAGLAAAAMLLLLLRTLRRRRLHQG